MNRVIAGLLLCLMASMVGAQDKPTLIGRPDTAVDFALRDIQTLSPEDQKNVWYVWIRDKSDKDWIAIYDWILNTSTSTANRILRSDKLIGDKEILLRLDLRLWFPNEKDRNRFKTVLFNYVDPTFYVQDTGEQQELETQEAEPEPRYDSQGRQITSSSSSRPAPKKAPKTVFSDAIVNVIPDAKQLQVLSGLFAPIVEADRWAAKSLSTIDGGLYYKLLGYEGLSQEEWLALFGVNEETSRVTGGESFIGMWRSGVTTKPRRAKLVFGTAARPTGGVPLCVITQDFLDGPIDVTRHPMYSVGETDYDATEIIAVRPNGTLGYSLFDGKGVLQDEAPPNLVSDHRIPDPSTTRLQCAISCIRCHGPSNQWLPMRNDVASLLNEGVIIQEEGVDVQALFNKSTDRILERARDDIEFMSIEATDLQLEGDGYAVQAAEILAKRYEEHVFDDVGPEKALVELGIRGAPATMLRDLFQEYVGFRTDPVIASLTLNTPIPVSREDWEAVFPQALEQAIQFGGIDVSKISPDPGPDPGVDDSTESSTD